MASYTFTDDGITIKIVTDTSTYSIPKQELKLKVTGNNLSITDYTGSFSFNINFDVDTVSGFTSPETLRSTLEGYIETGGSTSGNITTVGVEFTRPSNTTAYTVKDVVGNTGSAAVITLTNIARIAGGSGTVSKVKVVTDQKTNVAQYRVHFYNVTPTPIADNSPFLFLYADNSKHLGYIDTPVLATEDATNSTGAYGINTADNLDFVAASGTRDLIAVIETLTAFTPASAQKFYLEVTVLNK